MSVFWFCRRTDECGWRPYAWAREVHVSGSGLKACQSIREPAHRSTLLQPRQQTITSLFHTAADRAPWWGLAGQQHGRAVGGAGLQGGASAKGQWSGSSDRAVPASDGAPCQPLPRPLLCRDSSSAPRMCRWLTAASCSTTSWACCRRTVCRRPPAPACSLPSHAGFLSPTTAADPSSLSPRHLAQTWRRYTRRCAVSWA